MVIVSNFDFEIVSAEDKIPFKEHQKNGKTFVEVEPDAEYFLKIRKLQEDGKDCRLSYAVDGKHTHYVNRVGTTAGFYGACSWSNSVKTKKALKFIKAPLTNEADHDATLAGMGKIEIKVYDSIFVGQRRTRDRDSPLATSSIQRVNEAPVTMKKNLRSGVGSHSESSYVGEWRNRYRNGDHLFTVTLYYCAAPALISVGVLPKPPLWEHHRMIHPASESAEEDKDYVVSESSNRRGQQIFVLE